MRRFEDLNPVVSFLILLSCAGISMFCFDPVMLVISLFGAAALWILRNGTGGIKLNIAMLLLFLLVPAINALTVHRGNTILFIMNNKPITLESLLYGVMTAAMLVGAFLWFRSFSQIMTSDRLLHVFGFLSPKTALLFTMTLRFVPLYAQQAKKTEDAQRAVGIYNENTAIDTVKGKMRIFSTLTTWALENGVITADSMACRGSGTARRTSFSRYKWRKSDIKALIITVLCTAYCIYAITSKNTGFEFYPVISPPPRGVITILAYIVFSVLAFMPAFIEAKELIKWTQLKSKI